MEMAVETFFFFPIYQFSTQWLYDDWNWRPNSEKIVIYVFLLEKFLLAERTFFLSVINFYYQSFCHLLLLGK